METGKCKCGCGGDTKVALKTKTIRGHVKGELMPFLPHHTSNKKHGYSRTSEYNSFSNAQQRCTNPNKHNYKEYGGRGIEFRFKSFEEFIAEIGPKPEPKELYSVDRKNNSGHYEVGNVKWSTDKEQSANKRKWGTA